MISPSVRFPYVLRYRMYWLRLQAQTFLQYVFCGVDVPVVDSAAGWARPRPYRQVFRAGPLVAAEGADGIDNRNGLNLDTPQPEAAGKELPLPKSKLPNGPRLP